MASATTVRLTANFERNLETIRAFLAEQDATAAYPALLNDPFDRIIPSLERFPDIGIDFLARAPQSREGLAHLERLKGRLDEQVRLRECIAREYLILYAVRGSNLYLLAIKHHRQLSFDLKAHWGL
jgi:ParE toxin of type II toxin-antitoxin system, parDE